MLTINNTLDGYLKDVEIKGNTIQDTSNLADIRSVGDKVEGQELYEIPVLSCGKNLFNPLNKNIECSIGGSQNKVTYKVEGDKIILKSNPSVNSDWGWVEFKNIKVTPNKSYTIHPNATVIKGNVCVFVFDSNNTKLFEIPNISKTFIPTTKHISIRLYVQTTTLYTDAEIHYKAQLEEGTVATPYEPYVEDKLTILSPVKLEKVGDVADRIVCKDGVWGVEKNVESITFSGDEDYSICYPNASFYSIKCKNLFNIVDINESTPCIISSGKYLNRTSWSSHSFVSGNECIFNTVNEKGYFQFAFKREGEFTSLENCVNYIKKNNFTVKVALKEPQFIPLPHDQQVKLRTFAGKTNISFGCEIEGTIKAQVPKSLGATVNTHTEQINNLNKELDRVKKLEESTVSTVTTESNFTTVEATSNGYFEDVKLEGKTLVNLCPKVVFNNNPWSTNFIKPNIVAGCSYKLKLFNKPSNVSQIQISNVSETNILIKRTSIDINDEVVFNVSSDYNINESVKVYAYNNVGGSVNVSSMDVAIFDIGFGVNHINYFEGLKSVGQSTSEDGADEISVESVKGDGNLFDGELFSGWVSNGIVNQVKLGSSDNIITNYIKVKPNQDYANSFNFSYVWIFDRNRNFIKVITKNSPINVENGEYAIFGRSVAKTDIPNIDMSKIQIVKGTKISGYTPHQSDKKRLLYYNNETQAWEKPILRQWDSIEKHADGKYYYHQRSGEVVLNGSESWNKSSKADKTTTRFYLKLSDIKVPSANYIPIDLICDKINNSVSVDDSYEKDIENISVTSDSYLCINISNSKLSTQDVQGFKQWLQANNVTVVYQLAQEKVYECTNIDLITYSRETNYVVESGVLSPRTTLKVHNNISNVVSLLQKKVSLLESNITSYMITQNRLQLSSTYSADSVTFKVDYAVCSENRSQENYNTDLYNLILNNILVGKDNYDYDHMFNIIMDYASWSQISWGQFDILVGIMDLQHNPPIEPPIEEVPCETPEE